MNIKKLPNKMDPNIMIRQYVHAKYGLICPFCSEVKQSKYSTDDLYEMGGKIYTFEGKEMSPCISKEEVCRLGRPKSTNFFEWLKNLFKKKEVWVKFIYTCHSCGAIWESSEFPDEIKVSLNKESPLSKIDRDEWTVTHSDHGLYISRM